MNSKVIVLKEDHYDLETNTTIPKGTKLTQTGKRPGEICCCGSGIEAWIPKEKIKEETTTV